MLQEGLGGGELRHGEASCGEVVLRGGAAMCGDCVSELVGSEDERPIGRFRYITSDSEVEWVN